MKYMAKTQRVLFAVTILIVPFTYVSFANALEYHSNCNQCHILHSGPGSNLLHAVNSETVCMSCHDGSVTGAPEVNIHETTDTVFLASCIDCHDTHSNKDNYEGGVNVSMVGFSTALAEDSYAKIISNNDDDGEYFNVAFEEDREFWRSNPRTDGRNGRRVCQVCHDVPEFGMHPMNDDCTANCHKHSDGFMRVGGRP